MVEPAIVGAIAGALITAVSMGLLATIGFIVRKVWNRETEGVPNLEQRIQAIEQIVHGAEDRPGHLSRTDENFEQVFNRLESIEVKIDDTREKQSAEHEAVMDKIETIVDVLHQHEINGDLEEV